MPPVIDRQTDISRNNMLIRTSKLTRLTSPTWIGFRPMSRVPKVAFTIELTVKHAIWRIRLTRLSLPFRSLTRFISVLLPTHLNAETSTHPSKKRNMLPEIFAANPLDITSVEFIEIDVDSQLFSKETADGRVPIKLPHLRMSR